MVSHLGAILRLAGPLIQLYHLRFLIAAKPGDRLYGLPIEKALWLGFLVGLVATVIGIFLSAKRRKPRNPYRIDRDLNLR